MKYNLKNRPNPWHYNYADINQALKSREELEKWFEGFEKELREQYKQLCKTRIWNIHDDAQAVFIEEIVDSEPDEILGLKPKKKEAS